MLSDCIENIIPLIWIARVYDKICQNPANAKLLKMFRITYFKS